MSVFIWIILIIAGTAVHTEGCSHGVHRSAEITIFTNRFQFHGHLHELDSIRRFAEELQNATDRQVIVHLGMYDIKEVPEIFRIQGPVRFVPLKFYVADYINSMTWRPQPGTGHRSHILILLVNGLDPYSYMEPKIHKLKRAGVEVFVMRLQGFENYELFDIVSYPPKTHSYNQLDYPSLDTALSALARSVCRSMEVKERKVKKALLSQVRLAGGGDRCRGRVELLYNNTWGWLSDRHWDRPGADVVCRQLGCGPSLEAMKGDPFGPAPSNVLERVDCIGNEHDVSECLLGTWNEPHATRPENNAGVSCLSSGAGDIRLVNGSGRCDGIVEVSLNDSWNRFCLWNFDVREASVVCRQMGCGPLVKIQDIVMGEPGGGWRTVEETYCSGAESRISECSLSVWSLQPCLQNIHASIICSTSDISKVALTEGSGACSGKVKVFQDNKWHMVPAFEWHVEEEAVLCRQLGCHLAVERAQVKKMSVREGRSPHTDLRSIYCAGHEASLSKCSSVLAKGHKMDSGEAEVMCSQAGVSRVRLVGGDSGCSGRVEVFYQRAWGTVCDDTWDLNDAHVVCRQVGCGPTLRAPGGAYFGPGNGSIWLEKLFCTGNETAISDCAGVTSKNSLCIHAQDAGVICTEIQGVGSRSEERGAD